MAKKGHSCARCQKHKAGMSVFRKPNGRLFVLCRDCLKAVRGKGRLV